MNEVCVNMAGQARSAHPIEMEAVSRAILGSGFQRFFAGMIERDPKVEVWAIPAKSGGSRAFCESYETVWAQGEGQPGLAIIFFRMERRRDCCAGPLAKNIGLSARQLLPHQLGLGDGEFSNLCGWVFHQNLQAFARRLLVPAVRQRACLIDEEPVWRCAGCRFPDV